MKNLFYLLTLLLFFNCKSNLQSKHIAVTSNELEEMVSYLASDELSGRDTGSEGIEAAAVYIENKFQYTFDSTKGYTNQAFYIMKYNERLELEVVE